MVWCTIAEAIRDYGPDYGFTSEQTRFDFATLRKNREAYIDRSRNSYDGSFKRNGVERIEGRARFVDSHTIEVNGETIKAKHIVIATGAHPFIPSVPGAEFGETSGKFKQVIESGRTSDRNPLQTTFGIRADRMEYVC